MLELFTFLRSGGTLDQIDVRVLDKDGQASLRQIDIRRAECFLYRDKHALLAVVESAYGSFGNFNDACRKILLAKLGEDKNENPADKTTQLFSVPDKGLKDVEVSV